MYDKSKVAFIDIETTGLHPDMCDIWEIAIIVDDIEHIFHPQVARSAHIDEWVRKNTRFTEYGSLRDIEPQWVVMDKVHDLLKGRHLIGACPWFDSERLHRMWRTYHPEGNVLEGHSHPWHYHLIDIESLVIGYVTGSDLRSDFPVGLPWKSEEVLSLLDIEPQDIETRHTAIGDCRYVKKIFEAIYLTD